MVEIGLLEDILFQEEYLFLMLQDGYAWDSNGDWLVPQWFIFK